MNASQRSHLNSLVGSSFHFEGKHLLIHEVLADQNTLVLMLLDEQPSIQSNQYGEPRRRAPEILSISMEADAQGALHPLVDFLVRR
jgi:hypothetical protein